MTQALQPDSDGPFGLFETLGFDGTAWRFVEEHLERMAGSARAFGLPFDDSAFETALGGVDTEPGVPVLVRIDLGASGALKTRVRPMTPLPDPVRLVVTPVRVASHEAWLRHKTTRRTPYDAALADARRRGADDGLLLNEHGHVTETSRFTVFIRSAAGLLLTPPLSDGVLAGVLRQHLLDAGRAIESPLGPEDLAGADVWVGNAARGLLQARLVAA